MLSPRYILSKHRSLFFCVYTCLVLHHGSYEHSDEPQPANLHRKPSCGLHSIISLELLITAYSRYLACIRLKDCFVLAGQRHPAAWDTSDLIWKRMLNPMAQRKSLLFTNLYKAT